ncbi:MAG TPA: BON domain-containing protein [Gemmatimonadaceae bacterium]|nr:BON domain-containing protein [Gemmatimonadaceae bacterium]
MAQDFENTDDTAGMSDGELRAFVRDRIEQQLAFDPEDIEIAVRNGVVRLSGRVGTESEYRVVEHLLTDVLGLSEVRNELVVDPIRRAESPIAIDEHLADENAHEGLLLGDRPGTDSPEADHLREDVRAELLGTTDVQKAIEGAIPWIPPESPTPEGLSGTDASSGVLGEDH